MTLRCPVIKPGQLGFCIHECNTDMDCPYGKKCCFKGCGNSFSNQSQFDIFSNVSIFLNSALWGVRAFAIRSLRVIYPFQGVLERKGGVVDFLLCAVISYIPKHCLYFTLMLLFHSANAECLKQRTTLLTRMNWKLWHRFYPSVDIKEWS